jgi:hypothetical protein
VAGNSPYDTAVANTAGLTNSWFFRDAAGPHTAVATTGAVNGTFSGTYGIGDLVSPLARDLSTPLSSRADVVAGFHLGGATGPSTPLTGFCQFGDNFDFPALAPFSCSVFVRLRGDQNNTYTWSEMEVVDKCPTASRNGWDIAITATTHAVIFRRWVAGVAESVTSLPLTPQVWYLIVATYDGALLRLYVDDNAVVAGSSVGSLPGNATNFCIGATNGGTTAFFDGDVGPLAIYNRAISDSEVTTLFNAAFVTTPRSFYANSSTGSDTYDGTAATYAGTVSVGTATASETGFIATYTVANSLVAGNYVTVTGCNISGYNGTRLLVNTATSTAFTVVLSVSGLSTSTASAVVQTLVGPWASFYKAGLSLQAGDTCTFAYNAGVPYVETQVRPYTSMAYAGTKRSVVTFTSDQVAEIGLPSASTPRPIIQFGTLSTGTSLGNTTSITRVGTLATYTVASTTGLLAGLSYVTVTGATPAGYNVSGALVVSVPSGTTFTVTLPADPGGSASVQGAVQTGIDLTNAQKVYLLQQSYHLINGLKFTQPLFGSSGGAWADRLVAFFGQQYGTVVGTTTVLSGDGTTMVYTVANSLVTGATVTVTGAVPSGYNVTDGVVVAATGTTFSVRGATTGAQSTAGVVQQQMQGEVQTVSGTPTGAWTLTLAGNSAANLAGAGTTAAQLQTALRATVSTTAPGAGPLADVICTGGPLPTAINVFWQAGQQFPFQCMAYTNMVPGGAGVGSTVVGSTRRGSNGTRWYQSADFCIIQRCHLSNANQPYKSAIDTGSQFIYNYVEGCQVGIGCVNSNAPIFANNYFYMNGHGQTLRNGGALRQDDVIQSKGGTRNAQIYGNVIRVPVGATALTGVAIYVGGGGNDMNGQYDVTLATGREGYNNVAYNNVVIGDYIDAISYGGIVIAGGQNDTVVNNVVINATTAFRVNTGGLWETTNARPKSDSPTLANNIAYQSATGSTFANGFRWGTNQATDLGTGVITYSSNMRYQMAVANDAMTTNPEVNDVGANLVDPQFVNWLSDWHILPSSLANHAGVVITRTPYGNGYVRTTRFDLSHDIEGQARDPIAPTLGIYAFAEGAENDVSVINGAATYGVDTVNVGPGAVGSGSELLRQIMVLGDPASQGQVQRVSLNGQGLVVPYSLHENLIQGNPAAITTTTPTTLLAAAGINLRSYLTDITVVNSHATVGTLVTIADAGGTIWQGYAAAAGGGVALTFPAPRRQPTTNAVITVTCGTTGANVYVSVGGFKAL